MFSHDSDGEVEEEQDEDTQWRMKRFEREQWLKENKVRCENMFQFIVW